MRFDLILLQLPLFQQERFPCLFLFLLNFFFFVCAFRLLPSSTDERRSMNITNGVALNKQKVWERVNCDINKYSRFIKSWLYAHCDAQQNETQKQKNKHKRYKNILFICDWVCACHPHFELLLWYTKEKCAEEIDSCQCAQSAHIEANDMRFVVQFLSHSTVCVFVLSVWAMLEPLAETKIHHESRIHHRKRYVPRMAIVSFSILNLFSFYILHAIILITKREHNFDAVGRKGNMELFRNISLMRMNAWMHYE